MNPKLIRVTTVPVSLRKLLVGQLAFMSDYFDVVAISSDGDCFEQMLREQGGIRGERVEMSRKITPIKDLIALFRLIRLFSNEKPLIVHSHTPKAGTLAMIAAWVCRVPIRLHTVAGLPLLEATGGKRLLLDWVERLTYACATKVYPNSVGLKQIILENKYTSSKKLSVIGNGSSNGIDTHYFSKNETVKSCANQVEELRDEETFTFIFVGRIVRDKGINELIRAFVELAKDHDLVRLILVGEFERELDPLDSEVETLILQHPQIQFVGFQNDVRPYFVVADALVFPSYREGFPNVVMQAGAIGLPSIVTDINGCNEIITQDLNGVIIPPKDQKALYGAMKRFVDEREWLEQLSSNARAQIESRYEQKLVWKKLLEEYQSFCEK